VIPKTPPEMSQIEERTQRDRIAHVTTRVIAVPLPRPVAWSNVRVSEREFLFVWLTTENGVEGMGFSVGSRFRGGAAVIRSVVDEVLTPILVGRDPAEIERLWEEMYFRGLLLGTRGAVMRAISAVDVALWDILGKTAGRRLCDLLGRYRDEVPAYASGGYYYDDDFDRDLANLEEEIERHVSLGFNAVKIKIGRLSPTKDRKRVERTLEIAGPDIRVAVDANHAWRDPASALNDLRHLDGLGLWWIEEPVLPDQIAASAEIARKLITPIATGEIEAGRWAFASIVNSRAASILQADATVAGGISEWLKIAGMAASNDVAMAPHWIPHIHVHLGAATANVISLEYFHTATGVLNLDALLARPLDLVDGNVRLPSGPGHGIELDMDALAHYERRD
jgi:L-alanine-DL-glutamate epimerase-like enolase superfamily enzyme